MLVILYFSTYECREFLIGTEPLKEGHVMGKLEDFLAVS